MTTNLTAFPIVADAYSDLPVIALPLVATDGLIVNRGGTLGRCTLVDLLSNQQTIYRAAVSGAVYNLPTVPLTSFLLVYLDGVLQVPANYGLVGAVLTFTGLTMTDYLNLTVVYV